LRVQFLFDPDRVRDRLKDIVEDEDLRKYLL
jgi:ATP-dependent protease HslVU (ClpYQ) ATPase subunit